MESVPIALYVRSYLEVYSYLILPQSRDLSDFRYRLTYECLSLLTFDSQLAFVFPLIHLMRLVQGFIDPPLIFKPKLVLH